jgi:hypothetical protein
MAHLIDSPTVQPWHNVTPKKHFKLTDVTPQGSIITNGIQDLINSPMWFHKQGLSETSSGYGRKLNSGLKISFCGKLYRIYTTCFSNVGSNWFTAKGRKIYIH